MIKKMARILAGIFVLVFVINAISLSAATPDYIVVSIPEERPSNGRGFYPVSIYRDSSTYCWMCNSGKPGTFYNPADYIFEFYVPNSFKNLPGPRTGLRITGTNVIADCYIPDKVSARVYPNDTIRVCIGWYSVVLKCCGIDAAIWIK